MTGSLWQITEEPRGQPSARGGGSPSCKWIQRDFVGTCIWSPDSFWCWSQTTLARTQLTSGPAQHGHLSCLDLEICCERSCLNHFLCSPLQHSTTCDRFPYLDARALNCGRWLLLQPVQLAGLCQCVAKLACELSMGEMEPRRTLMWRAVGIGTVWLDQIWCAWRQLIAKLFC